MKKTLLSLLPILLFALYSRPVMAQMEFIENKGQWHSNVQYLSGFNAGSFFLEKNGFTVALHDTGDLKKSIELGHLSGKPVVIHSFAYKVNFLDAATNSSKVVPEKPLASYNNYYIGNDPAKWAGNCKIFQAITYQNIYPNIDIRYYSEGNNLKYDFLVHPGGNPGAIAMQYAGPQLSVKDKQLIIKTSVAEVKELYPYSYQVINGKKNEVDCKYVLRNNVVTFDLKDYDPNSLLVIDPTLIFSTYTGSTAENWGFTATPGPDGSLYAGGIAFDDGGNYPVSPGAYQTTNAGGPTEDNFGGYDIALFKFSPNGSNRTYATYLGGSGNEQPHSMIVDRDGNLIIEGRTNSGNYPITTPVKGPGGNYDIVITKFNSAGNALLGSVRIGGSGDDGVNIAPKYRHPPTGAVSIRRNYGDDSRSEIILDNSNNIIVVGCTQSANFPTIGISLNSSGGFGGAQDGVVLKFNSNLSSYMYGSYFGGSGDDGCFVANYSPVADYLYVAGGTTSSDLPGEKSGVIYPGYKGGETDGYVTKIKIDSGIVRTTYMGTGGIDLVFGLKFDKKGYPYIMGTTTGSWPISPSGIFANPNSGQFICKLQPDLSSFVYTTSFGTGGNLPNISPIAFMVDRCENVYVSGWGGGLNGTGSQATNQQYHQGNTNGLPEVNPLPNIPNPDGADFYFFVLKKNAQSQLFGSHFGQFGQLGDHVDGGTSRFDDNGIIYQAVCSCSDNPNVQVPTTPGAWARKSGSLSCNEALLKIKLDFAGVGAGLQPEIDGVKYDTAGCAPLTVVFRDTVRLGQTYYWSFGDNATATSTGGDVSHTYNNVGTYLVMLISEDVNTCNVRDTAYVHIRVGNNRANLSFKASKDTPCTSTSYTFYNTTTTTFATPGFTPQSFTWDYGDGSPVETSFNGRHTFPGPGKYVIKLTINDTNYCNSPETFIDTLRVYSLVKSAFKTPQLGCAPYYAQFSFTGGEAGTDFFWEFGDGTFSTDSTDAFPVHLYANPGVYRVRLIVRDTNTCNKIDTSAYFTITVLSKPIPAFTFAPNPPQRNTATQFTNLSTGAVRYLWDFGEEGETSTEVNPKHQFNSTGTFSVKLTAYNQNNCDSSITLLVSAIIDPLLDVPNAFTPGRFGINGVVSVKGYGIGKMDWRIYNRWGQMVYRSTSRKQNGWDGTFKGKLQPMDVYTYTLDVVFTDGKKLRKTGDITLLR